MPGTATYASMLPYWDVQDGFVALRNRRIGLGFQIFFPPTHLMEAEGLERLGNTLAQVLRQVVPVGGSMRFYLTSSSVKVGLPTPLQRLMDNAEAAEPRRGSLLADLTRSRFGRYSLLAAEGKVRLWSAYLTLLYTPPVWDPKGFSPETWGAAIGPGRQYSELVVSTLRGAGIEAEKLDSEGLETLLFDYLNPSLRRERIPRGENLLERVCLSTVVNDFPERIRVGSSYLTVVSMLSGPDLLAPGMLERLNGLGSDFWLMLEYEHVDQAAASAKLNHLKAQLKTIQEELGRRADPETAAYAQMIEEALYSRAISGEHVYRAGGSVVLTARDWVSLEDARRSALAGLGSLSGIRAVARPPYVFRSWVSLAPFSGTSGPYSWLSLDRPAAYLMPLRSPWAGSPGAYAYYISRDGALVGINTFDRRMSAYNGLVVGGSGSGKTFFTQSLLASFALTGGFIAIIDKGGGYIPLMELLGGQVINLRVGEPGLTINPFDLEPGQIEPNDEKKDFLRRVLQLMIGGEAYSPRGESILMESIVRVYRAAYTEMRQGGEVRGNFVTPILSDFARVMHSLASLGDDAALDQEDRRLIDEFGKTLLSWRGNTPLGRLFDGPTTLNLQDRLVYFETTGITGNERLLPVGILVLSDLIMRRVVGLGPGIPKLIVFDEVWALFKHKAAADFVEDLYRRLRRYNAGAISVSQSIGDFVEARGVLQNTNTFFLMPSPGDRPLLKQQLGLSDGAIETYASLVQMREVFTLMRIAGRMEGDVLQFLPSAAEVFAFSTRPEDQEERARLQRELGGLDRVIRHKQVQEYLRAALPSGAD